METTETTATEQAQDAAAQTEATTTTEAAATEPSKPDDPILAAVADLGSKVDQVLAGREQEQQAEPVDLLDALAGEPEAEAAEAAASQATEQAGSPEAQRELEELERFIDQRAEAKFAPFIQQQREAEVRALAEKYPDITSKEVLPRVEARMADLVRRSGNESLLTDAAVVETVYMAAKAELANAGAASAEQAGNDGASLETNAGRSQAGGSSDARDTYISEVFGTSAPRSLIG